jgi:hypothetical protein
MKLTNVPFLELVSKNQPNTKKLVLTDKVLLEVRKIKFKTLDDMTLSLYEDTKTMNEYNQYVNSLFKTLPDRQCFLYYVGMDRFIYNYSKHGNDVIIVQSYLKDLNTILEYVTIHNLETGKTSCVYRCNSQEVEMDDDVFSDVIFKTTLPDGTKFEEDFKTWCFNCMVELVLKPLIYIELSENNVKVIDVKPNTSFGHVLKGNHFKNQTKLNLTYVDSRWNLTTMSIGSFKVSGHFRLQRCGVGFSDVKLIYIESFSKEHYIRRSTRELVFN